jgi:hypothetical protein
MYENKLNYIKLEDCIEGNLYKIHSRNLTHGIFTKFNNGFLGIREKFGSTYLFTEYHWDTGAPFGTVSPLIDLGKSPFNLESRDIEHAPFVGKDKEVVKEDVELYEKIFKYLEEHKKS